MKIFSTILLLSLVGCSNGGTDGGTEQGAGTNPLFLTSLTEQQARDLSPTGDICIFGTIEEVFVPSNRGRGNDNGEWVTMDNRTFEPAFKRMDVNYDGILNSSDAQLATRNIYVKQIERERCPAVADIATFPQGLGADSFFTAEDIYQWRDARQQGVQTIFDRLPAEDRALICQSACTIINHMSPDFK